MRQNISDVLGDVSILGFGAWAIGGDSNPLSYGATDDAVSKEALRHALNECGCTLIDTADVYGAGHSERLIGDVLAGDNSPVTLVTKIGNNFTVTPQTKDFGLRYCRDALEASEQRLGRTPDVVLMHNPRITDLQGTEMWETMRSLKATYGVKVGVSYRDTGSMLLPVADDVDVVQVPYNLINRKAQDFMQRCWDSGIAVLAREPLASGVLTLSLEGRQLDMTDFRAAWSAEQVAQFTEIARSMISETPDAHLLTPAQRAIAWVMMNQDITCTLVGCKTPAQVQENMGKWTDGEL